MADSRFEKGWRAFKVTVYWAGALFALFIAVSFYLKKDAPPVAGAPVAVNVKKAASPPAAPPPATSPLVAQLERAEQDRKDLLKPLMEGLKRVDDAEAQQVAEWLLPRRMRGELPYFYFIGMYYGKQSATAKKTEGLGYLMKGALIYRVDAGKCADRTANQAVPIIESALGMPAIREGFKKRPDLRESVLKDALSYESSTGERPLPLWICAHGIERHAPPDEKTFQAHRESVRAQFMTSF